jgi:hypothetical protein
MGLTPGARLDELKSLHGKALDKKQKAEKEMNSAWKLISSVEETKTRKEKRDKKSQDPNFKKNRRSYLRAVDTFKKAVAKYDRINQQFRRYVINLADVPKCYHKNAKIKGKKDGCIHIFFGGLGKPIGPGKAHYVLNEDGELKYQREKGAPHGPQNHMPPRNHLASVICT